MDETPDATAEEDEGKTQSVVFTERLKSGYSTARNKELEKLSEERKKIREKWECLGPDNVGGRVTCLIATKTEPYGKCLLAGAACGGLWNGTVEDHDSKLQCEWNENAGKSQNGDDKLLLMHNIGALAVEQNTIYCGTGHAYHAGDSFPGVGLFRSEDNGASWKLVKKAGKNFPQRISTIAVNGGHVWIGGVVLPDEQEWESGDVECSGIFYSETGGDTWEREPFRLNKKFARRIGLSTGAASISEKGIFKDRDYQCHSIVFLKKPSDDAPDAPILAALTSSMGWGGIWRSRDRGRTWEQLKRGLPSPREFGRTSLAVAPTDPQVVYAFAGAADGRCLGVFRTSDGGDHWVRHGFEHFAGCGNLNYVNGLAVSPKNPDMVVCGARDLHRSVDGGHTWTQVTEWFAAPDSSGYSHADHHAVLWPVQNRLYSANDGGVDVSGDEGVTWTNLNSGLAIAMFYDIDVASYQNADYLPELIIAGGTQDNATVMTDFRASGIGYVPTCSGLQLGLTRAIAEKLWDGLQLGPGPQKSYAVINLDASGITNFSNEATVQLFVSELEHIGPQQSRTSPPGAGDKPEPKSKRARNFVDMLFGDGGWTVFDQQDPLHVYASSQNMTIYRHRRDNGWRVVTPAGLGDEERNKIWMAILAMDPNDPNIVFSGSTRVWRTKNDGVDWTAVSDDLDGSPITAIEIANNDPNFIYVGTENGNIFKSTDGGNRWSEEPGDDGPKPMEWRKGLQERRTIGVARTITRIEAHPKNARKIAVTLMGFDRNYRLPHVLWFDGEAEQRGKKDGWIDLSGPRSEGHGFAHHLSVTQVDAGLPNPSEQVRRDVDVQLSLPNVHFNVVTWDEEGNYLFVGNDIGVWALNTNGDRFEKENARYEWVNISANLPNAIVTDLVYNAATHSLVAATYGRSIWRAGESLWTGATGVAPERV
jgi:photosystem II stability/assembly factor-like uncharacterized protein